MKQKKKLKFALVANYFLFFIVCRCQRILHRECISQSRPCHLQSPTSVTPVPLSRSAPSIGQACACRSYNGGNNEDHLTFETGDIIQITRKLSVVLWEGRIGNRAGFFPAQHVEEISSLNLEEYPWFAGELIITNLCVCYKCAPYKLTGGLGS